MYGFLIIREGKFYLLKIIAGGQFLPAPEMKTHLPEGLRIKFLNLHLPGKISSGFIRSGLTPTMPGLNEKLSLPRL